MFMDEVLPASGHGLLASEEEWTTLLNMLPEAAAPVRNKILAIWAKKPSESSPREKWFELKRHLSIFVKEMSKSGSGKAAKKITSNEQSRLESWPMEIVFKYTYPRLDINVSKMRNHLVSVNFWPLRFTGIFSSKFRYSLF